MYSHKKSKRCLAVKHEKELEALKKELEELKATVQPEQ
jgi:hypothetical protein